MTTEQLLNQATASGDVAAYGAVMEELTGWTCQPAYSELEGAGIAWLDPYGDQSGDLFQSIEDLIGETYDTLLIAAQAADNGGEAW